MPKLRKLKVTSLKKHQDAIHVFLCKLGVTQYITIDTNKDTYLGMLQVCPIPDDSANINLDLQLRIKKICEKFNFKLEEKIDTADSLPGNTIDELLSYIEEQLVNIEEDLADLEAKITSNKVDANNQDEIPDRNSSIEDHPDFNNIRSNLSKLNEMTKTVDILLETRSSMTQCDTIIYFEIWVIEEFVPKVKEGILNLTDGKSVIVEKEDLSPEIVRWVVKAPLITKKTQPGQFVILRVTKNGERIPLTVADSDKEKGTITLIFQKIGKSTKLMGTMQAGDHILNLLGPLGKPVEIKKWGTVAVLGGGCGVALRHYRQVAQHHGYGRHADAGGNRGE